MKNLVHEQDPKAYIAINEVADIFPAAGIDTPQVHKPKELPADEDQE